MPVPIHEQAKIDKFFEEIASFEAAYRYPSFRFIAIRHKGEWILCRGMVALDLAPREFLPHFEKADIYAGDLALSEIASSPREFLKLLLSGSVELADRALKFPADHTGNHTAIHFTFDGGRYSQDQAGKLTVNGSNSVYYISNEAEIIRQLKTSDGAFQSIQELAAQLHMDFDSSMYIHVDVLAPRVAEITNNSCVEHEHAGIELRLSGALDHERASLALRGTSYSGRELRLAMPPMLWKQDDAKDWRCAFDVPFPDGKSVACTLSYGNFVQHQQIITEPLSLHDPLRFVYGQWNSAGKAFAEIIDRREAGGRAGEDFEDCVAAMLSLCGFRTLSVDRLPGLNKLAPDIVAADTKGNLLIVECTVKLPKADDKLGNLFNRYKAIREGLDRAGLDHIQTLPVLAVALSRDDISSYLGAAKDAGILLWGREDLHKLKCSVESKSANEIFDAIKAEKFMQDLS